MNYKVFSEIPNVINMTTCVEFTDKASAITFVVSQVDLGYIAKVIFNGRLELILC